MLRERGASTRRDSHLFAWPIEKNWCCSLDKIQCCALKKTNQPTWGTFLRREPNDTSEMTAFGELRCCCLCYKHSTQQIHLSATHASLAWWAAVALLLPASSNFQSMWHTEFNPVLFTAFTLAFLLQDYKFAQKKKGNLIGNHFGICCRQAVLWKAHTDTGHEK